MSKYRGCDHRGDYCRCARLCGIRDCKDLAFKKIPGTRKWRCKQHFENNPSVFLPKATEALEADIRIRRLEQRVAVVEKLLYTMMTGRVEIQGDMHLLECNKRNDENNACSCGAVPLGSPNRKRKE